MGACCTRAQGMLAHGPPRPVVTNRDVVRLLRTRLCEHCGMRMTRAHKDACSACSTPYKTQLVCHGCLMLVRNTRGTRFCGYCGQALLSFVGALAAD